VSFGRCVEFVLAREGEWSPDRRTRWGFDQRFHPDLELENFTREQAIQRYRERYWNLIKGDALPWPVSLVCLDEAVHDGPQDAAKTLQVALRPRYKGKIDGDIGPQTLGALGRTDAAELVFEMLSIRWRELLQRHFNHDGRTQMFGFGNRLLLLALEAGKG
jgi:lysozyme family protein